MNTTEVCDAIKNALPEIDKLGNFPIFNVTDSFCESQGLLGRYHAYENKISIKSTTDALTIAHEIGHWAYEKIYERELNRLQVSRPIPKGKILDSSWSELENKGSVVARNILGLFDAIKKTPSYQELSKWIDQEKPDDFLYYGSFLTLSENWANAFAQTVAICGNNNDVRVELINAVSSAADKFDSELSMCLSDTLGYWQDDEFCKAEISRHVKEIIKAVA